MRPQIRFLDDPLIDRILDEARDLLATVGVAVHNDEAVALLTSHGARLDDAGRVLTPPPVVAEALKTAPREVRLFDAVGELTHELTALNVYFTPGSAAIHVLDESSGALRPPSTEDYVRYVKVVSGLKHIASQSTALIPAEVPEAVSDAYRLYLSLLLGEKPVVTGAFTAEGFHLMRDLLL